eukprot:9001978-Pyramimonas_sp.AAC.1
MGSLVGRLPTPRVGHAVGPPHELGHAVHVVQASLSDVLGVDPGGCDRHPAPIDVRASPPP